MIARKPATARAATGGRAATRGAATRGAATRGAATRGAAARAAAGGSAAPRSLRRPFAVTAAVLLGLGLTATAAQADPGPARPAGTASTTIIGGQDATTPYAFMVSVQDRAGHFCGASMITDEWAVTARHCIDPHVPEDLRLRVGSLRKDQGGEARKAARLVWYPAGGNVKHDIGLIKLDRPVPGAAVALDDRQPVGTPVRLLGWGCTISGQFCGDDGQPEVLQQLDSAIRRPARCTDPETPIDAASEVCTGNADTKSGPCFGDSGGPLVRDTPAGWRLIGAFSRVEHAPPDPGEPDEGPNCRSGEGIYTDVPAHRAWIDSVISPAS
ncbi:serine protease [Actinomadura graeca]|uniref:Serine protease n=1 Tax=Actinomadura graeca TaxID=2750812 RepID=A0ABX8QTP8_9ACTN|nr:serine protease [Actinomadura graeca]QXJ22111.1 serine protease [Actinomadura graeca]